MDEMEDNDDFKREIKNEYILRKVPKHNESGVSLS